MYALTNDLARLAPPTPEMTALVESLQGNDADTSRFLGVMSGTVRVVDFFAPDNFNRIMGTELVI